MQVNECLFNTIFVNRCGHIVCVGLDSIVSIAHSHTDTTVFEHLYIVSTVAEGNAFASVDTEMT